jgi:DNA adenine methylase
MRHPSPLRYPGGKSCLTQFLEDAIDLNDLRDCRYYEPYAGGAGAALKLLYRGVVSELFLNDLDRRVYAFWKAVLNNTDEFVNRIGTVPLTIAEWKHQYDICRRPRKHKLFDVGFAAFYMNRCNRSGVISGAGPIGGYEQLGSWRMDVRFNRQTLSDRVVELGKHRGSITVFNVDAITFLRTKLPRGRQRTEVFVYLDPPYVVNGQRLYLNSYVRSDHAALARYLAAQRTVRWLVSYDDNNLVRKLYAGQRIKKLGIQYALQHKRSADELIIVPSQVATPSYCRQASGSKKLVKVA